MSIILGSMTFSLPYTSNKLSVDEIQDMNLDETVLGRFQNRTVAVFERCFVGLAFDAKRCKISFVQPGVRDLRLGKCGPRNQSVVKA